MTRTHSPRSLDWWIRDDEGRVTLGQWPNPAIWVWVVARVFAWTDLTGLADDRLSDIGRGALIVWAADELFRGASPFRRLLGVLVLGFQLFFLLG